MLHNQMPTLYDYREHISTIKRQHRRARLRERDIERIQNETFHEWLNSYVSCKI